MKNDINKVAQTIAKEISKIKAGTPAEHGTFHATLGWTERKSEAHQMAGWFLSKVEKFNPENKEDFLKLQSELRDLALVEVGE